MTWKSALSQERSKRRQNHSWMYGRRGPCFGDLSYWPILGTPHYVDLMHITKNVFESLLEEETDGPKGKRVKRNDYYCHPSCFTLSPNEIEQLIKCLLGV